LSTDNDLELIRVGDSPNGLGVFATRELNVREVVGELAGTVIEGADYESDYCIELDSQSSFEPSEPFRFMNHSCDPNCELASDIEDPTEIWVEVIRNIPPDEELTIDYGWPANDAIACNCGSPKCRGWVVAANQLDSLAYYQAEELSDF